MGNFGENNIVLDGNHTGILYKSKDYLSEILGKPMMVDVQIEEIEKIHVILANQCPELEVITSDSNEISSKSIDIIEDRIQAIDLGNNNF